MSDGNVEMIIDKRDGKVIQRFNRPMEEVVYEPQNAIDVACAMTDAAFEARDGVKPAGETLKSELIERHRMLLTQRFTLVIGSMRCDNKKSNGKMAQELVDIALKEIF